MHSGAERTLEMNLLALLHRQEESDLREEERLVPVSWVDFFSVPHRIFDALDTWTFYMLSK